MFAWDAGWYRDVATHGYGALPVDALRFFPLYPLLGRWVGLVAGGPATGLVLVANVASFGFIAAAAWLARLELTDPGAGERVAWLLALSPGSVVLGLPYAEGLCGLFSVLFILGVRRNAPWLAAVSGALAGLTRPVGALLVGVALLDLIFRRPLDTTDAAERSIVVASPLAGTAVYLLWVDSVRGDAFLPYSVTRNPYLHGSGLSNPLRVLPTIPTAVSRFDPRVDIAIVLLAVVLCVVACWSLPISYGAWSGVTVFAAVTSSTGASVPRYVFSAFPLFFILARLLDTRRLLWQVTLTLFAASFFAYAVVGLSPNVTL